MKSGCFYLISTTYVLLEALQTLSSCPRINSGF